MGLLLKEGLKSFLQEWPLASVAQLDMRPTGDQGPVVQSIVSFTSSLRVISLTISADSMYSILIFFAEKM